MEKYATKKAVSQLQKVFNIVGKYGGIIEARNPGTSWILDVEVLDGTESSKDIIIGIYSIFNGEGMYYSSFALSLSMEEEKIINARITTYESQTSIARFVINEDDMLTSRFGIEKDRYGLRKRFSTFMNTLVDYGPYLNNAKEIKKIIYTLADG